jgi:hypothetical protein
VQGAPACVTVNVRPPIAIVAVRGEVLVFAAPLYVTVPLPVPVAPPVTVSHVALLVAVHAQPVPEVTPTVPVPPAATTDPLDAESV